MEVMRMKIPRAASLPDDLIAAILVRVPYPSLCRFKCVSRLWLSICSDPGIRRKCPQTLSGFFFLGEELCPSGYAPRFVNASGRGRAMVDPSLSFLPPSHRDMTIVDSCNGLLLCCRLNPRGDVSCYFVCNPATRRWIELPGSEATMNPSLSAAIRLGFDTAVSSHFKVFCVHNEKDFAVLDRRTEAGIYSSETGAWTYRQIEWDDAAIVNGSSKSVFFNGTLHLTTLDPLLSSVDFPEVDTLHLTTLDSFLSSVEFPEEEDDTLHLTTLESSLVTVGMDGKTWRRIPTPRNFDFIGASQGHLYGVYKDYRHEVSVWVLEDYAGQEWKLKHTITGPDLFGDSTIIRKFHMVHAIIHPERSLMFLTVGPARNLISYNFVTRKVHAISTLGENSKPPCPYIPCFSEWLSDGY
ncbi:unnamed protein product [Urochloa decumbens]|uniref:F-box domain-containing protein n=1 Tax=Urochloa decumbens TaxID=240449 RepID=A0ABC9GID4_9POAL